MKRRRPIATVRVLRLPQLAPGAVRVEVDCRHSTTGITSLPGGPLELDVPMLTTIAVYTHEEQCGSCDTSDAHERGDERIRDATERAAAGLRVRERRN